MIEAIKTLIGCIIIIVILIITTIYEFTYRENFHGSAEPPIKPEILYHGSNKKLDTVKPRESLFPDAPAVFATSPYDDAVIFSASWTDYNFIMWRDGNRVYLEEQYPGAFEKLDE